MMNCQCQAGFFVLRACGSPAVLQCGSCGRFMCQVHTAMALPQPTCLDCSARQYQGTDYSADDEDPERYTDAWVYGLRGRHYDARDAGAFVAADREIEELDDIQGGFGDS